MRQRGFTLLEVTIAMVIGGLVIAALFRGAGAGIRNTLVAAHYQEAVSRARSRLAMAGASLRPGTQEGDDGGGYHWRLSVTPEAVPARASHSEVPVLYAVTIAISWTMDGAAREVSLSTLRLGVMTRAAP